MPELFVSLDGQGTLFSQLYRALRHAVLGGRLAPGSRLPSTRTLGRALGLSRTTTSAVYEQLLAEGYFESRKGSGTFVATELPPAPAIAHDDRARAERAPRLSPWAERLTASDLGYPYDALLEQPRARYEFLYGVVDAGAFPGAPFRRIISRLLRRPRGRSLGYSLPEGLPELRSAISEQLARTRGISCHPRQVLVVSGAQQALSLIARVLIGGRGAALLEEPHYVGARRVLAAEGAELIGVPVDADGLDLSRVSAHKSRRARLAVVTPSHQFPTGAVMSLARRLELLDWARRADGFVIEDDYDSEFRYQGRPLESLYALDKGERVIYVGTFSKTLAPALRIGFVIAPEPLLPALRAAKWLADWASATIEQQALAELISEGHFDRHLRRVRARYARRRDTLLAALECELGDSVEVVGADAGLHLLAWLRDVPLARLDALACAAREQSVGIHPVTPCYLGTPPGAGLIFGHARLSEAEIREGIRRLAATLSCFQRG